MALTRLSFDDVVRRLEQTPHPSRKDYMAMYSSWYGGIVTDPELMMLPIDDHMVHRGDGVFEAIKCVDCKIYALDRHLERLARSAEMVSLKLPHSIQELREICVETTKASNAIHALLRFYISRGPGGFTTNPYEVISAQVYLVITPLRSLLQEKYDKGVSVMVSSIPVKEGIFATVKSCNYLPNVLMKKEAMDRGVDFSVSKDENGYLAESSTENFAIVTKEGDFLVPGFSRTLKGVTAVRAMELAEKHLVPKGILRSVRNAHITKEDVFNAAEAMMLGTTLDCLPVTLFESRAVGGGPGQIGPVNRELYRLFKYDMQSGPLVTDLPS